MDPVVETYESLQPARYTRLIRLSLHPSGQPGTERLDLEIVVGPAHGERDRLTLTFGEVEGFRCEELSYPFFNYLVVTSTRDRGWQAPRYLVSSADQGPLSFGCMTVEAAIQTE